MTTVASFELRSEHYRKGLEETGEDLLSEYYQRHCALALAAREAGLEVAVSGVNVKYKKHYFPLSQPVEWLVIAFDNMSRDRQTQGLDYVLGKFTPLSLPATILLIFDDEKLLWNAVRKEELKEE